ncbi:hypothetical protein HK405_000799 [Cladochytrium tenue]|nr:hypothetical protein HK405_000799 [Cladochytrium tenue]
MVNGYFLWRGVRRAAPWTSASNVLQATQRRQQQQRGLQFLVLAYDHTDPGSVARRLAARGKHLERAVPATVTGRILFGGAILDDDQTGPAVMRGSVMVIEAASEAEARAFLDADPYVTGGVWDGYKLIPFRTAVMAPSSGGSVGSNKGSDGGEGVRPGPK